MTDTYREAAWRRLGRSPDASTASAGVSSTGRGAGPVAGAACRDDCRGSGDLGVLPAELVGRADVDDGRRAGLTSDEHAEFWWRCAARTGCSRWRPRSSSGPRHTCSGERPPKMMNTFIADRCTDLAGRCVLSSVEGVPIGVLRAATRPVEPDSSHARRRRTGRTRREDP